MEDELLDLVDQNDRVIGTINRNEYSSLLDQKSGYVRAAELIIINSQGQIYMPVRTADKTIAPNGYDYSAGGHVTAGEDYLDTIIREAKEEINLDITADDVELLAKLVSPDTRYIRTVYLLRRDITLEPNPADFASASWMTPAELLVSIAVGHASKDSLPKTITLLQQYLKAY